MPTLNALTRKIVAFRDARDWKQFHNPKDTAISLSLEAAELLEHFQWKNPAEIERHIKANKAAIGEELADLCDPILVEFAGLQLWHVARVEAVHRPDQPDQLEVPLVADPVSEGLQGAHADIGLVGRQGEGAGRAIAEVQELHHQDARDGAVIVPDSRADVDRALTSGRDQLEVPLGGPVASDVVIATW